jgi:AbrB family looped-hinge helix DNA binding protein
MGKMAYSTKLTTKGQVVIPKPVRERLGWRAGLRLRVEVLSRDAVRLQMRPEAETDAADPIERGFGMFHGLDLLADLEAEHREEVQADERRRRRR